MLMQTLLESKCVICVAADNLQCSKSVTSLVPFPVRMPLWTVYSEADLEGLQQILLTHEEPLTVIQSEVLSRFSAGLRNSSGPACDF